MTSSKAPLGSPPLAELAGHTRRLSARAPLVFAALIAAHGVAGREGSFRASDVRFFYLLFSNWIELDVLQPGQDLDLTQVRRALTRLARDGGALPVKRATATTRVRGSRWSLTARGLLSVIEALVDPRPRRPFDESLFVICFAALYRNAVAARLGPSEAVARRRVRELLDPRRVLKSARRTLDELHTDLKRRVEEGRMLVREAARAREQGANRRDAARWLEKTSSYQLHRVRPLSELLDSLPDDLARIELGEGIGWRTQALFEPMADVVRAQHAALDALEKRLADMRDDRS